MTFQRSALTSWIVAGRGARSAPGAAPQRPPGCTSANPRNPRRGPPCLCHFRSSRGTGAHT
eukprot:465285-Pyramimonas_sp.AAC.1